MSYDDWLTTPPPMESAPDVEEDEVDIDRLELDEDLPEGWDLPL